MTLDGTRAERFSRIALGNVVEEYPNHPGHVLNGPGDAVTPRALHPAFYGSYDWHSAVHMHWLLARVLRLHPAVATAAAIRDVLDRHLTPAAIAVEAAYFQRPGTQSFERTYGWSWLLALAAELDAAADVSADAARWRDALQPLTTTIVGRFVDYLPRADYPIRHGLHANSAFGLLLALRYARSSRAGALADTIVAKAHAWFAGDRDLPARWEPSGADFLSPALMEAQLMASAMRADAFPAWLSGALPRLVDGEPACLFTPAAVSDRADPQIVHLDGLNLSRAWCLRRIAATWPAGDPRALRLLDSAERHLHAGLVGIDSGDYVGSHWLATFATLALTA